MEILVAVCIAGSVAMLIAKLIPSRVQLDRVLYDLEMQEAYKELREGRMIDRNRSEFTANRMLAK